MVSSLLGVATDYYDIGFGVFFEWWNLKIHRVTVHVSDSEDEDEDELLIGRRGGAERPEEEGSESGGKRDIFLLIIGPYLMYCSNIQTDCHEEVYAGCQLSLPGSLPLKFDNSYSLEI